MVMPETLPLAEIKAHLSEIVDRVQEQHERVTLTRNGRPAAVLISPDDLEARGTRSTFSRIPKRGGRSSELAPRSRTARGSMRTSCEPGTWTRSDAPPSVGARRRSVCGTHLGPIPEKAAAASVGFLVGRTSAARRASRVSWRLGVGPTASSTSSTRNVDGSSCCGSITGLASTARADSWIVPLRRSRLSRRDRAASGRGRLSARAARRLRR